MVILYNVTVAITIVTLAKLEMISGYLLQKTA